MDGKAWYKKPEIVFSGIGVVVISPFINSVIPEPIQLVTNIFNNVKKYYLYFLVIGLVASILIACLYIMKYRNLNREKSKLIQHINEKEKEFDQLLKQLSYLQNENNGVKKREIEKLQDEICNLDEENKDISRIVGAFQQLSKYYYDLRFALYENKIITEKTINNIFSIIEDFLRCY